jgi:hypothetical protein
VFRAIFRAILLVAEKILSEVALLAALISIAWQGDLYQRILGGLISLYDTAKGFALAYYYNDELSGVWKSFTEIFNERLATAEKNIESNPQLVLVAFLLTYVCYKLAAKVLRLARKGMGGRHKPKVARSPKKPEKSTAYQELYKPPELSPSTKDYLERE